MYNHTASNIVMSLVRGCEPTVVNNNENPNNHLRLQFTSSCYKIINDIVQNPILHANDHAIDTICYVILNDFQRLNAIDFPPNHHLTVSEKLQTILEGYRIIMDDTYTHIIALNSLPTTQENRNSINFSMIINYARNQFINACNEILNHVGNNNNICQAILDDFQTKTAEISIAIEFSRNMNMIEDQFSNVLATLQDILGNVNPNVLPENQNTQVNNNMNH